MFRFRAEWQGSVPVGNNSKKWYVTIETIGLIVRIGKQLGHYAIEKFSLGFTHMSKLTFIGSQHFSSG